MFFDDLPATVGVAIATPDGSVTSFGEWSSGVAWSTIKVPLAVAALRAGIAVDTAITRSDNAAAEELWSRLGDDAAGKVQAVLRDAGDAATVVESQRLRAEFTPFGQTRWSLVDQARFAAGLSRVGHIVPIIYLMSNLCAEHRWGLASKGFPAKGGWGPGLGADHLVRQFAMVPSTSGTFGVALAADVADGGEEAGIEVVNTLADWALERLAEQ